MRESKSQHSRGVEEILKGILKPKTNQKTECTLHSIEQPIKTEFSSVQAAAVMCPHVAERENTITTLMAKT